MKATSSLDTKTELEVMEAINNPKNKVTIILIAHRLSTIEDCDNIFIIDTGHLVEEGRFKDLNIENFKLMNSKN